MRVVVTDAQRLSADALARALGREDHLVVLGAAAAVDEAVRLCREHQLDVLVADRDLPISGGVSAVLGATARAPRLASVLVAANPRPADLTEALGAGCATVIAKSQPLGDLVTAITQAARGYRATEPALYVRLFPHLRPGGSGAAHRLSPREIEVLQLVAEGHSYGEIALICDLQLNTVRNHVQNILRKLEVHSRMEAVSLATREGVIRFP